MNGSPGSSTVLVRDSVACCKIAGRANFNGSVEFKHLLQTLQNRGVTRFILDLRECVLMDSTFVGMLARFGLTLAGQTSGSKMPSIALLGASERVSEMLDNLGVKSLFGRLVGPDEIPPGLTALDVRAGTPATPRSLTETSLEAHQTLMELNPENRRKFADVEKCLAEDLKKIAPERKT